jgi:hypothetical protein
MSGFLPNDVPSRPAGSSLLEEPVICLWQRNVSSALADKVASNNGKSRKE